MSVNKSKATVASALAIAMVLPAVKVSEGYWPTTKVDTIGTGRPCTGGYGETEGVKCGETHDEKYWSDRLGVRLKEYDARIGECIHVDAPDSVRAAMITTSYNAGTGAVCKSPMVARINTGDFKGACAALLTKDKAGNYNGWYIRAQGRIVKGLINRRRDDQKMCLSGVNEVPKASLVAPPQSDHATPRAGCGRDGLRCPEYEVPAKPAKPTGWRAWVFK